MTKNVTSSGILACSQNNNDIYILLVKDKNSDTWGFPKGHLVSGESLEDCAKRELLEETGIDKVDILSYLGNTSYSYNFNRNTYNKKAFYFLGRTSYTEKINVDEKEISSAKWVPISSVKDYISYPDLIDVFDKALTYLNQFSDLTSALSVTGERLVDSKFFKRETKQHHEARYSYVSEHLKGSESVLDVGCGSGYGSNLLSKHSKNVLGIDISTDAVRISSSKFNRKNSKYLFKVL